MSNREPSTENMECKIYRGVQGSGKSTAAKRHKNAKIFSADKFFEREDGSYQFLTELLPRAHQECLRGFIVACQASHPLVVVDNTNITVAEFAPYAAIAQAYGYHVEIITMKCDPVEAQKRNIHGVELKTVSSRHDVLLRENRNIPRWWKHVIVDTSPKGARE